MGRRFDQRCALVTGAASGIGRECAARLLHEGARVMLTDVRRDAVKHAASELDNTDHLRVRAMDVTDPAAVEGALAHAWDELGPVDVLVNAAGLYPSDPLLNMGEAAWDRVIDTNLKGPFVCTGAFARRLVAATTPGCVVNISSGSARRARPGAGHYATSKAGLEMLTKSQALELATHGIRVNAVAPGFVRVDSTVNPLSDTYIQAISAGIPLGRAGKPSDIAAAAMFLCSHEAAWITGSVLSVDGGSGAGSPQLPLSDPNADDPADSGPSPRTGQEEQ